MTNLLAALAPVFLAIFAGWVIRATGMVSEAAWAGVSRLAYMVLSPVFIFTEVLKAELAFEQLAFVAAGCAAFAVMGLLAFVMLPIAGKDRAAFASAQQGVTRWNTMVVLAAALALMGDKASALVALLMGPAIPVVNVITVAVHARWGEGQNPSLKGVLRSIALNPLIIVCVLGLAINAANIRLGQVATDTLSIVGKGALGVTLLCVGAGLDWKAMGDKPALMTVAVALKMIAGPLVFIGLGMLAGLHGLPLACLALCGAAPSPPSAYVLTREMGGDPRFMAGHITATNILAALAFPLAVMLAQAIG